MDGSKHSWEKLRTFLAQDGHREIEAFLSPATTEAARVLVVRHGFGKHNTFGGIGSVAHEDAELHETGVAQAKLVGEHWLRQHGIIARLNLAIVSPFTRALQTAQHMLGPDIGSGVGHDPNPGVSDVRLDSELELSPMDATPPAVAAPSADRPRGRLKILVQPLCAEQTYYISHIGRGNRGSTASDLSRREGFDIFDFSELERYCTDHRVSLRSPQHAGKWWHHGPHSNETVTSFKRRCTRLKRWLGSIVAEHDVPMHVILICHGGIMEDGFGCDPTPANCSFRTYDVFRDGSVRHVASLAGGPDMGWVDCPLLSEPAFKVHSVLRQGESCGCFALVQYHIELELRGEIHVLEATERQLRVQVHDWVQQRLEACEPRLSERYHLQGLFPSPGCGLVDPALRIQDYLQQLAEAIGQIGFPVEVAQQAYQILDCMRVRTPPMLGETPVAPSLNSIPTPSPPQTTQSASQMSSFTVQLTSHDHLSESLLGSSSSDTVIDLHSKVE